MRNRTASALAVALLLFGLDAQAQDPYGARPSRPDPYGPKPQAAPRAARDLSRVTPLLGVEDGTPRYARVPNLSSSGSDALNSQLLAFSLQDFLPVDAGRSSPLTTGEHGGIPVVWHYIVKFWQDWPNAKDRPGHTARLGETDFEIRHGSLAPPPPPEIRRVLDAQAAHFRDAIAAYPFIQRSADVMTRVSIIYHKDKDPSGTEVWGYNLSIQFGPETLRPEQLPNGRWRWTSFDWMSLNICSNCFSKLSTPSGRYRGLQTMQHKALVDTVARPLWVSEFRSGEGPLIPNPELYDPSRPPTDIQLLIIDGPTKNIGVGARDGPDSHSSRAIAATWLTDWKTLVDRANGPSAPRAD